MGCCLFGGEGGIRFSAEMAQATFSCCYAAIHLEPRAGKHATGMFAWTALSNPPYAKTERPGWGALFMAEKEGFEPSNGF